MKKSERHQAMYLLNFTFILNTMFIYFDNLFKFFFSLLLSQ